MVSGSEPGLTAAITDLLLGQTQPVVGCFPWLPTPTPGISNCCYGRRKEITYHIVRAWAVSNLIANVLIFLYWRG